MRITTILVVAAALVAAFTPAWTQTPGKSQHDRGVNARREKAEPRLLRELSKVCNLNAQQYGQIKIILETRAAQVHEAKRSSLTPDQMRDRIRAIQRETKAKIEAVLTPEQRARWEEYRKSKKHRDAPKPGVDPGITPGRKPGKDG